MVVNIIIQYVCIGLSGGINKGNNEVLYIPLHEYVFHIVSQKTAYSQKKLVLFFE